VPVGLDVVAREPRSKPEMTVSLSTAIQTAAYGDPFRGPGFSRVGKLQYGARTLPRSSGGQGNDEPKAPRPRKHRVHNLETEVKGGGVHGVDDGN
jgi:hypothetical protein